MRWPSRGPGVERVRAHRPWYIAPDLLAARTTRNGIVAHQFRAQGVTPSSRGPNYARVFLSLARKTRALSRAEVERTPGGLGRSDGPNGRSDARRTVPGVAV